MKLLVSLALLVLVTHGVSGWVITPVMQCPNGYGDNKILIRTDLGNNQATVLKILEDNGRISSASNTQKYQVGKAVEDLTAQKLEGDPATITTLVIVGTVFKGVRIDNQGTTSDGLYRNLAVQTNGVNSVNLAQALIPITYPVVHSDVRRALLTSLDKEVVIRLKVVPCDKRPGGFFG